MEQIRTTTTTALFFLCILASAQNRRPTSCDTENIYPFILGDTLIYEVSGKKDSELVFGFTDTIRKNGQLCLKMTAKELGVGQLLSSNPASGILLFETEELNGKKYHFEKGIRLMPKQLVVNRSHQYESSFKVQHKGKTEDMGIQRIVLKFLGFDSAYTPFQNFSQCLVLSVTTTRHFQSGKPSETTQSKQWHVAGIGLVKVATKKMIADQEVSRMFWHLKGAKINKKWLEKGLWRIPQQARKTNPAHVTSSQIRA